MKDEGEDEDDKNEDKSSAITLRPRSTRNKPSLSEVSET